MRELLEGSFRAALDATHPGRLVRAHLPAERPALVLAVGKAALPMLEAAREAYPGVPCLATPPAAGGGREGAGDDPDVIAGAHPVPDEASVRAAEAALARAAALAPDDELLVLVSGGGSALWAAPWGIGLAEKRELTRDLLRAGADIRELNAVRKHLSRIKGGRLAAATPARVTALLLSDVPGDDPAVIASGPTVPDPSTFADALAVLDRYGVAAPAARAHLERGAAGALPESPKPGGEAAARVRTRVVGSNQTLLEAARAYWEERGYRAAILSDRFEGEARELAGFHAALVRSVRAHGTPFARPVVLLSGGEATVTVRGGGRGGRNQEFALWLLRALRDEGVWGLVAGSDGIDGNSDAAGAFLTPDGWARARAANLSPDPFLADNDASGFFAAMGDLLVTGPTRHNLNDYRALVVE